MSNKQVENETVSIIIPVYNCEKYIRQCVDSAINQTYHDLEIILIDDGSTDGSIQILEEYYNLDNRVKVVHQANQGLSASRNIGVAMASGKYVFFLDADDFIGEDQIEVLWNTINKNNSDIAISNYTEFFEDTSQYKFYVLDTDYFEKTYSIKNWLNIQHNSQFNLNVVFTVAWGKLYKRKLLRDIIFPIGKIAEDNYTTWKVYLLANKVTYINKSFYIYRRTKNSITGGKSAYILSPIEAAEERITMYDLINHDTNEAEKREYIWRLQVARESALQNNDYVTYRDAIVKLKILKKYGIIDE